MPYGLGMSTVRIGIATAAILITVGYALGSSLWVSSDAGWYRSLVQPAWQPPDWIFGVIWPYNFIVLGIVGFIIAKQATILQAWLWLGFYFFKRDICSSLVLSVLCAAQYWCISNCACPSGFTNFTGTNNYISNKS